MTRGGIAVGIALLAACGGGGGTGDDVATPDAPAGTPDAPVVLGDRDRLLVSYLAFLQTRPDPQSNGLRGADLADTCALWTALDPSSQATFLTLTARLDGSRLADASSMLAHVTTLYRVVGGEGATAGDPGSCGGGEYNRMIVSIDEPLHGALLDAFTHQGAPDGSGVRDLADIPADGFWRDSHDLGGTHAPFDKSDETDDGAPRAQVQYFETTTSAVANAALGRIDLADVIDPYALEIDHDFDCVHNSNPSCSYTLYGPLCAPEANLPGTEIYVATYGDYQPAWQPASCN